MSPIVVPARWPPSFGKGDLSASKGGPARLVSNSSPPLPNPTGAVQTTPTQPTGDITGEGLVGRFSPIAGMTPTSVLDHAIWLPAILNTLTLTESALHNEYDTLSNGQFSQAAEGGPNIVTQLRELPIDTLLVAFDPKWLVVTGQNMIRLRNNIHGIVRSRAPVHLLVTWNPNPGAWPEVDMDITIRSVAREIRPAENDTLYMALSVKEWRDPRVTPKNHRPPAKKGGAGPGRSHKYKLTSSDTLRSLSMRFYGTYAFWREIRDANHVPRRWGASTPLVRLPGAFKPGLTITIPVVATVHNPPMPATGPAPTPIG